MTRPTKIQLSLLLAPAYLALMLYADGACAQVDLSGNWVVTEPAFAQLVNAGPPPGDFLGIPLNREGRALAAQESAIAAGRLDELGHQCRYWPTTTFAEGLFGAVIQPIVARVDDNDVLAWRINSTDTQPEMTIWVDGRKPPSPLALHTFGGVLIGHWEGNTLAVSITHLEDGQLSHNSAPESDQATVNMFMTREDDLLTTTYIVHDPVYLAAPYIRARTLRLSDQSPTYAHSTGSHCLPAELDSNLSDYTEEPLSNAPPLDYMMQQYGIPTQVALGGAQQMYPEFQKTLEQEYRRPSGYCTVRCCFSGGGGGVDVPCPKPVLVSGNTAESAEPRSTR